MDDLYRFEQGRTALRPGVRDTATTVPGFLIDTTREFLRQAVYGTADGRQAAWVRYPESRTTILIFTHDANADARALATRIVEKLLVK